MHVKPGHLQLSNLALHTPGLQVLFRVALALFKLNEEYLLSCNNAGGGLGAWLHMFSPHAIHQNIAGVSIGWGIGPSDGWS
jgi:hypothetical protein